MTRPSWYWFISKTHGSHRLPQSRGSAATDVGSILSMIIKLILILRNERIKNIVGISVSIVCIITKYKFELMKG